jgi:hypothetical protein
MKKRNFRNFITFLIALGVAVCLGRAPAGGKVSPAGQAKKRTPMTVEDVLTLAKAGVSEEVILAQIRAKHASFDLTADQLIRLKSASVSERVIRVMMEEPAPHHAPAKTAASSPALGSRAATPSKKPKARPAAPVEATVTARAAVPPKSASPPAPGSRATAPSKTGKAQAAPPAPVSVAARAPVPLESASPPAPGSRATAPSKTGKAQAAPPAPVSVAARAPVPLKPASPPAPVQWITHNDPMGFSVNVPAGWELHADRQAGRINIQGPAGQQAVIWPMFIPQQQLDARAAGTVVLQLARRVGARMTWGAPTLAGNTARVYARGQASGAALMRWNSSPDGTTIFLFCVSAPSSLYPTSVDTFAGILRSFRVMPDAKANSGVPVKGGAVAEPVSWVRWSDPREGAFSASVPQGWNVSGGAFRQSATDIRKSLIVLSPDRQIRVAVGDASIGAFTVPTPMYSRFGMREGTYTGLGDGSRLQIRRFLTAEQFLREYLATSVRRDCGDVRVLSEDQRQDLAASATQEVRAQGATNPHVTASGVSFSCTWNGREGRGYYAATTILPFPGRGGIWYVENLYGYLASAERQQQAEDITRHVLQSMGVNAQWRQREDQIAANAVAQDNARAQEFQARERQQTYENEQKTSDMIVKGYEQRQQAYDEIARRRENAILGTVDVVDPSSGKQYKIDNYSDYHWMNYQGVIAGTKTETSPGYDWHEMITLP